MDNSFPVQILSEERDYHAAPTLTLQRARRTDRVLRLSSTVPVQPANDETLYIVENILAQEYQDGELRFYIKWKGWGSSFNTWEPRRNLLFCDEALAAFFQQRMTVPKPQPPLSKRKARNQAEENEKKKRKLDEERKAAWNARLLQLESSTQLNNTVDTVDDVPIVIDLEISESDQTTSSDRETEVQATDAVAPSSSSSPRLTSEVDLIQKDAEETPSSSSSSQLNQAVKLTPEIDSSEVQVMDAVAPSSSSSPQPNQAKNATESQIINIEQVTELEVDSTRTSQALALSRQRQRTISTQTDELSVLNQLVPMEPVRSTATVPAQVESSTQSDAPMMNDQVEPIASTSTHEESRNTVIKTPVKKTRSKTADSSKNKKCPICNKDLTGMTYNQVYNHRRSHNPLKCDICNAEIKSGQPYVLKRHMEYAHSIKE